MVTLTEHINELILLHGSIEAVALNAELAPSYLWRLANGRATNPSDYVLRKLGLVRTVTVTYEYLTSDVSIEEPQRSMYGEY